MCLFSFHGLLIHYIIFVAKVKFIGSYTVKMDSMAQWQKFNYESTAICF